MSKGLTSWLPRVTGSLSREIPELLAEHRVPGLAIAICDASDVLWSATLGVKKEGTRDRITTATMFSVQSISKLYTATAVMLAVQDELVDLDTPITRYLPEFSIRSAFEDHAEERMTLRHLLSHTAGLTHEAPVGNNFLVGRASFTAHCRSIANTWLRFPVGHHYEYSNLGFDLAAYILQRATRLPFHEYVRRRLLAPLGLQHTTFNQHAVARDQDRAIGHSTQPRRVPLRIPMVGAGGLYTSVLDAARFLQLHLRRGSPLLQADRADEMCSVQFPHAGQEFGYGLGVASFLGGGVPVRGHSGGGFGFLADLYWAPSLGIGVVVLTNSVDHPLQISLVRRVITGLADASSQPPQPFPEARVLPPEAVSRTIGEYAGRAGWLRIAADDEHLVLIAGEQRERLRVVAPDEVMLEGDSRERFRFLRDEHGFIRYLLRVSDAVVWYRTEMPHRHELAGRWAALENTYAIRAQGAPIDRVRLVAVGSHLRYVGSNGAGSLELEEHMPGIFYSSTGEVLDITHDPPTYANIQLHRQP